MTTSYEISDYTVEHQANIVVQQALRSLLNSVSHEKITPVYGEITPVNGRLFLHDSNFSIIIYYGTNFVIVTD